jgi:hypothetical protein
VLGIITCGAVDRRRGRTAAGEPPVREGPLAATTATCHRPTPAIVPVTSAFTVSLVSRAVGEDVSPFSTEYDHYGYLAGDPLLASLFASRMNVKAVRTKQLMGALVLSWSLLTL